MKRLWLKPIGESWEERKALITTALESGFDAVMVNEGEEDLIRELGDIGVASPGGDADIRVARLDSEDDLDGPGSHDAALVEIESKERENLAAEAARRVGTLVVIGSDWKVIPLENLISELQTEAVELVAGADSAEEVKVALETLEAGADEALLMTDSPDEVKSAARVREEAEAESAGLAVAEITGVEPVGMGDRVCIDTTNLMEEGEGMLVGNSSSGMFLVHSESIETPYVDPRPFRVNAGGVHAYVRLPGGRTEYLSELESGDPVAVVDSGGDVRVGVVGRVKIEKRPMLLVEAESDGEEISLILQNAETIRLVTPDGKPLSVAEMEPGDEVLVHVESGGRHFGKQIEESIIEK
ncbi:MAG: 3-dehydroquinate synthase [Methanonatronarchaeales archaeon]|nr:3-dehydroquinate synthase [Methanonatronarchaeales archaeon]